MTMGIVVEPSKQDIDMKIEQIGQVMPSYRIRFAASACLFNIEHAC